MFGTNFRIETLDSGGIKVHQIFDDGTENPEYIQLEFLKNGDRIRVSHFNSYYNSDHVHWLI